MLVFFYVGDIHGAEIQRKNVDVITYRPFRHGAPLDWEDVRLPTREGVHQRLLIARGANAGNKAVILFMGGKGRNLTKRRRGRLKTNRNFLVRSAPLFARAGFVAAMAGLPSDINNREGMSDDFRGSQEHHADIRAAVDFLVSEGARDVFPDRHEQGFNVGCLPGLCDEAPKSQRLRSDRHARKNPVLHKQNQASRPDGSQHRR